MEYKTPISKCPVERRLSNHSIRGQVEVSKKQKEEKTRANTWDRLRNNSNFTVNYSRKKKHFTDVRKSEIDGSNRKVHVRRQTGERMIPQSIKSRVKHGVGKIYA